VQSREIVVINGSGGVGKDTFVDQCKKYCYVKNISSVDEIKEVARILGWDGVTKDEKTRKFLSDLKLLATEYSNSPFEYMKSEIDKFMNDDCFNFNYGQIKGIIVCHVREPEEIQKMKDYFKCSTLLITNNRIEQVKSNMADAGVYNFTYDYTVDNNGTINDLQAKALFFLDKIFK
jgi:hypothetical protein